MHEIYCKLDFFFFMEYRTQSCIMPWFSCESSALCSCVNRQCQAFVYKSGMIDEKQSECVVMHDHVCESSLLQSKHNMHMGGKVVFTKNKTETLYH